MEGEGVGGWSLSYKVGNHMFDGCLDGWVYMSMSLLMFCLFVLCL